MAACEFDAMVAVFERQPYWGPELKRQFEDRSIGVRECRAVSDLQESVYGFCAALVVMDFSAAPQECCGWLNRRFQQRWPFPVIVCASPETTNFEWSLRELGATAFLPDIIPGDQFARLCLWQLSLQPRPVRS